MLLISLMLFCYNYAVDAQSAANFIIEKFSLCKDVPNQKVEFIVTPKTFTLPQIVDLTLITPMPLGSQIKFHAYIELENKLTLNHWQHLVTIEDDFCRAIQFYVGTLAYDIQTAMGIPRRTCPFPKGHYHAVNYTIDFRKLQVQAFPFGKLRVNFKLLEKSNNNPVVCTIFIISNK